MFMSLRGSETDAGLHREQKAVTAIRSIAQLHVPAYQLCRLLCPSCCQAVRVHYDAMHQQCHHLPDTIAADGEQCYNAPSLHARSYAEKHIDVQLAL